MTTCWLCGFETTELATNTDAPTCTDGPCYICVVVEKVDKEINQAVATLRRLLAKRCNLRSEQNRVHGTLIHRLPIELKNYIFQLLLPSRDEWGETPQYQKPVLPSLLASTCRVWREITWSNPSLWSTIRLELGEYTTVFDLARRVNIIHDWMRRSQSLPLTLHISVRDNLKVTDELRDIIDAICQYSNRWHSLSLSMPFQLLRFFHCDSDHIPLRRIRINDTEGSDGDQALPFLNPKMSPETIDIVDLPFRSLLHISWNRLTTAKVERFNVDEIAQLFQHAPQMTHCHISSPLRGPEVFPIPTITHQRLESLSLYSLFQGHALQILDSLTLPNLREFHTNNIHFLFPVCLPTLVHRSASPSPRITLRLQDFGNMTASISSTFFGVTNLVVETLPDIYQALAFKDILLAEDFPDLRHLTLRPAAFLALWDENHIPLLLDRKRPRPDRPNEKRLHKFEVVVLGEDQRLYWSCIISQIGGDLKTMGVRFMEDGFEFW